MREIVKDISSRSLRLEGVKNKETLSEIKWKERLPIETVHFIRSNHQKKKLMNLEPEIVK